jgi:hypothetical protein
MKPPVPPPGPAPVPQSVRDGATRDTNRWRRVGLFVGLVAALAGTFRMYLGPDLMLDVGTFMQWCGLR